MVKQSWKNDNAECTSTLGGTYTAPMRCDSDFLGVVDYDPDLAMSVISWKLLEDLGCKISDNGDHKMLTKNGSSLSAKLEWVEGILVGNINDIIDAFCTGKHLHANWKGSRADAPSDHLSNFKLISNLSNAEIRRLDRVHRALQTMLSPSEKDLINRINDGELSDTNFTGDDVKTYFDIFEKDVAALRGKEKDKMHETTNISQEIKEGETGLHCDVFFVCKMAYLITVESTSLHVTVTELLTRTSDELITTLGDIKQYYLSHGLNVICTEFDRGGPNPVDLKRITGIKTLPTSTHSSVAELMIKIVKERIRCVVSILPYSMSKKIMLHIVMAAVMAVNTIRRDNIQSSAQLAVTGVAQDYVSQFALAPGEYCEVHLTSSSSVTTARTVAAIALHPDPSNMKEWFFLSLDTGETFIRHHAEAYPLPFNNQIIDRLNFLSTSNPVSSDDEVGVGEPLVNYQPKFHQPVVRRRGRPRLRRDNNAEQQVVEEAAEAVIAEEAGEEAIIAMCSYRVVEDSNDEEMGKIDYEKRVFYQVPEDGELVEVLPDGCSTYCCTSEEYARHCYSSQMSAKDSIDQYGKEQTSASIRKEVRGLIDKNVFSVISSSIDLRGKEVIPMSLFLTMKRDGTLKSRVVAGGHRQRFYDMSKTSSPAVSNQGLFSTISIGATEKRKFMTMDINQAYLRADIDEEIYMWIDKNVAAEIIAIQPEQKVFLTEGGKLLVKLNKALYGLVQSGKLWYEKVSSWLISRGFVANKMDPCIFNRVKMDGGHQLTIALYVDDLLVTCVSQTLLNEFRREIEEEYELSSVSCGEKVEYLGIKINTSSGNYAELTMEGFIEDLLKENSVSGTSRVPASLSLFEIDDSECRLEKEEAERFHSVVASLLYLSLKIRPELLVAVTFLCSRVDKSTKQDMRKLYKVLNYLNFTKHLGCRLGDSDGTIGLHVYCDASFAVHPDAKSVGGIYASLGTGPIWCKCGKQKLVSRSSTEAELIALSDGVSLALWAKSFLEEQGYKVRGELYEDNQSTMKLAENGRSQSDRTRHINIRYYFIKQYLENGELNLNYCPTLSMIADALTKPLQGKQFEFLRSLLLGYK